MQTISQRGPQRFPMWMALGLGLWAATALARADAYTENAPPAVVAAAAKRAHDAYTNAQQRFLEATNNPTAAWELARACFDCADRASNNAQRTIFAQEGMRAAERAIAINPQLGAAYYYLGLNQGQFARTRKLTALGMLDDIERSWTKAIELDPKFDFAGPHRSIGVLYRDAPGWPLSLGNRAKARQHLEKAVQVAPEYPDNQICLLESYLDWGDKAAVKARLPAAQKLFEAAQQQLTGAPWELSWHDWNHRWSLIRAKALVGEATTARAR